MADPNAILNVPDTPPLDHEYRHHVWPTIPPNVHRAIQQLRETTYGVFHDSVGLMNTTLRDATEILHQ